MIVDIHTHMIYGIDDGASDREMSVTLMKMDYMQGVRGIFCTNHSFGMKIGYEDYYRRYEELRQAVMDSCPGLSLYKGCEIACHRTSMPDIIERIRTGIFPTMNESRYVLMEFNPKLTMGMDEMLYCMEYTLDKGYIPIIAHVERYKNLYDDPLEDLIKLKKLGCMTQINLYSVEQDAGFVSGGSRKELANLFLRNKLIDFAGTDSHRLDYKSPEAETGAAVIRERYGNFYADRVLFENAKVYLSVNC